MRSEYWTFQNRPDSWGQEHWGLQSRSYRHDQFRNVLLAFLVKVTHQFFSTEDLETALKTHYFFLCLAAQKAVQETKYCSYWSIDVIDHGVSSHQHYKEARGTTSLGIGIYSLPRLRDLFWNLTSGSLCPQCVFGSRASKMADCPRVPCYQGLSCMHQEQLNFAVSSRTVAWL